MDHHAGDLVPFRVAIPGQMAAFVNDEHLEAKFFSQIPAGTAPENPAPTTMMRELCLDFTMNAALSFHPPGNFQD